MELLPEGQKNKTQVSYEDQQKINEFSKLIMRKDNIDQELAKNNQEKEYLEDASLELELIDEEDTVPYKFGEIFLYLKQPDAIEQLEKDSEAMQEKIDNLESKQSDIESRLAELKSALYAKFGNAINLER